MPVVTRRCCRSCAGIHREPVRRRDCCHAWASIHDDQVLRTAASTLGREQQLLASDKVVAIPWPATSLRFGASLICSGDMLGLLACNMHTQALLSKLWSLRSTTHTCASASIRWPTLLGHAAPSLSAWSPSGCQAVSTRTLQAAVLRLPPRAGRAYTCRCCPNNLVACTTAFCTHIPTGAHGVRRTQRPRRAPHCTDETARPERHSLARRMRSAFSGIPESAQELQLPCGARATRPDDLQCQNALSSVVAFCTVEQCRLRGSQTSCFRLQQGSTIAALQISRAALLAQPTDNRVLRLVISW